MLVIAAITIDLLLGFGATCIIAGIVMIIINQNDGVV